MHAIKVNLHTEKKPITCMGKSNWKN